MNSTLFTNANSYRRNNGFYDIFCILSNPNFSELKELRYLISNGVKLEKWIARIYVITQRIVHSLQMEKLKYMRKGPVSTKIFMFMRSRTRGSWKTSIPSKIMTSDGLTYINYTKRILVDKKPFEKVKYTQRKT